MLLHIALIAETLTTIICIFCIYGEKFKLDKKTITAFLSILFILEVININHLDGKYSFWVYVVLFIYCTVEFRSAISDTLISIILWMIIVTAMQFLCILLTNSLLADAEYLRNAVSNMLLLVIFILLSPTNRLYKIKKSICKNNKFKFIMLGFICFILMIILLQGKVNYEIHMQYFILAIPSILMLLFAVVKWDDAQSEAERMRERLFEIEGDKKNYETLLTKVRLSQYALKNHMEAIASFHYTYKTSGELVQIEEEYCNQLLKENKYNDLLSIGDDTLTGYLCGKFQTAEDDGIEIDYRIAAEISQCRVPIYHVIEMLGILFDNAMEAVKEMAGKEIFFATCEEDDQYEFLIRNPFPYVPYEEIEEWFRFEKSEKGSGRGLGLYHLKCLCREWDCDIQCRNVEINRKNWIAFSLRIGKRETDSI